MGNLDFLKDSWNFLFCDSPDRDVKTSFEEVNFALTIFILLMQLKKKMDTTVVSPLSVNLKEGGEKREKRRERSNKTMNYWYIIL